MKGALVNTPLPPVRTGSNYGSSRLSYDERWAAYIAASVRETLNRMPVRAGDRVLDVGCGTGSLLSALLHREPDIAAAGVDISPAMLEVARTKLDPSVPLVAAGAERLPFSDATFDIVVSSSSMHYWREVDVALREIVRVLRPDGHLVLTDWCTDYLTVRVLDAVLRITERRHAAYNRLGCDRALAQAGFVDRRIDRYKIDCFWGLMTAVATGPRAKPRSPSATESRN